MCHCVRGVWVCHCVRGLELTAVGWPAVQLGLGRQLNGPCGSFEPRVRAEGAGGFALCTASSPCWFLSWIDLGGFRTRDVSRTTMWGSSVCAVCVWGCCVCVGGWFLLSFLAPDFGPYVLQDLAGGRL